MESRAKLFGHAIHPMLIPFPLGLLSTAVVFDVIHLLRGKGPWGQVAFWNIATGVISGLAAAVPGILDWLSIPARTRAKGVGLWHGAGNVLVLGLFSTSWLLRRKRPMQPHPLAICLAVLGAILSAVTGWLGGELVARLSVSVDEGAHLDAPSSLSGRAAAELASPANKLSWHA